MKSPGPNGFGTCFYRKHWNLNDEKVNYIILNILQEVSMASSFNSVYITLIPKKKCSHLVVNNFRPISLCNVVYKLISKVITNIVKPFIDLIISRSQRAFIPYRIIMDNILITHDLLHSMKINIRGKMKRISVKLDMSKAYDQVEWPYMKATMKALEFTNLWIQLVMSCDTRVNYSILLNGKLSYNFTPSRGLQQGDSLSLYFFLFCAKELSSLLNRSEQIGDT